MIVNDMEVEKMFEEEGKNQMGLDDDPYKVTIPENILVYLRVASPKIEPISPVPDTTNDDPGNPSEGSTGADNIAGPY